eukprot:gene25805-31164_t
MSSPTPPPKPPRRGQSSSPVPEVRSASPPPPPPPPPSRPAQTGSSPLRPVISVKADEPTSNFVKKSPFLKNNGSNGTATSSQQSPRSSSPKPSPPPPPQANQARSVSPPSFVPPPPKLSPTNSLGRSQSPPKPPPPPPRMRPPTLTSTSAAATTITSTNSSSVATSPVSSSSRTVAVSLSADSADAANNAHTSVSSSENSARASSPMPRKLSISLASFMPSMRMARKTSNSTNAIVWDDNVILQGLLSKRNREGKFDKCHFILTTEQVKYARLPLTSSKTATVDMEIQLEESAYRSIPLDTVVFMPVEEEDYPDCVKRERAFRLMSKVKSFVIRAKTVELKDEWLEVFTNAVETYRAEKKIPKPDVASLAPIWKLAEVNACEICEKRFGLLVRKHHCRNCGRCVCESCSNEKVRLPKLDPRALFKVCSLCANAIKNERTYGV